MILMLLYGAKFCFPCFSVFCCSDSNYVGCVELFLFPWKHTLFLGNTRSGILGNHFHERYISSLLMSPLAPLDFMVSTLLITEEVGWNELEEMTFSTHLFAQKGTFPWKSKRAIVSEPSLKLVWRWLNGIEVWTDYGEKIWRDLRCTRSHTTNILLLIWFRNYKFFFIYHRKP